ncbi:MAG: shikimate kinase [Lachnospiraceae bacterium]|jgi:shikimate kinase|nr:shikimate kinase [Lachnospiraceae bacterium]MDY5216104.1 shikimate kinase [Lachnospiraceae bacterium]MDY5640290.1 shikimate kinase [Lachnospiraceae bacterium]
MADNYVLIGYMGAGKTTVGKQLASKCGKQFADTDAMIVEREKMSINDIFAKYGESHFRTIETNLLKEMMDSMSGYVISCGGGLPLKEENRAYLKRLGKVIYLKADESDIIKRLKNDNTRPLLKGPKDEVRAKVHGMLEIRNPIYEEAADSVIVTSDKKISEIVAEIIKDEE